MAYFLSGSWLQPEHGQEDGRQHPGLQLSSKKRDGISNENIEAKPFNVIREIWNCPQWTTLLSFFFPPFLKKTLTNNFEGFWLQWSQQISHLNQIGRSSFKANACFYEKSMWFEFLIGFHNFSWVCWMKVLVTAPVFFVGVIMAFFWREKRDRLEQ